MRVRWLSLALTLVGMGCGGDEGDGAPIPPPAAACTPAAGGGQTATHMPALTLSLKDADQEGWLASPAVADLDRDNAQEIIIGRAGRLVVYRPDGSVKWSVQVPSRIWASPVVGDFAGDANLEVVIGAADKVYMYNAAGMSLSGFPVTWTGEVRSLAAGDLDGDGKLEIVAATTKPSSSSAPRDLIMAWRGNGQAQSGFPPNTSGTSGCNAMCYVTGGYDQNLAVGPIDGDASWDIFASQDNAYMSWHKGSGVAFDANPIFRNRTKVPGIRFMLNYAEAQQGYGNNESTSNQAHFTNTGPAIADLDGDGDSELIALGSVQNAAQSDRLRGVALFVFNADGTRPEPWVEPYHVPEYRAGLWDFDGTNIVGATNQVAIGDLDPAVAGLDMVFAGFDGKIHLVGADKRERWAYTFTTANNVLTDGVVLADVSGDGVVEVIFATYSTQQNASALHIVDATGRLQHRIALPRRGSMATPTVADVDGDGTLEIIVNLKDAEPGVHSALVYNVPSSAGNCVQWGTGRGGLLRNGTFRKAP